MGMSTVVAARGSAARSGAFVAGGFAAWLCGAAAIALAGTLVVTLAAAGWRDLVPVLGGSDIVASLQSSAILIGLAMPPAVVVSFLAGISASEPAIGGAAARLLNVALRAGPGIPSVVLGVAAFAAITSNPRLQTLVVLHPIVAAAVALAAFNVPLMTARFRTVMRAVPRRWRTAATAAGATPESAFLRIVLPLAWPAIVAIVFNGIGQMLGETALVAIVMRFDQVPVAPPLAVHLWSRLALRPVDATSIPAIAAETLVLVGTIVALRFAARVLQHRWRSVGSPV
jgi:ABC-type phosphate transport system permease subunit